MFQNPLVSDVEYSWLRSNLSRSTLLTRINKTSIDTIIFADTISRALVFVLFIILAVMRKRQEYIQDVLIFDRDLAADSKPPDQMGEDSEPVDPATITVDEHKPISTTEYVPEFFDLSRIPDAPPAQ